MTIKVKISIVVLLSCYFIHVRGEILEKQKEPQENSAASEISKGKENTQQSANSTQSTGQPKTSERVESNSDAKSNETRQIEKGKTPSVDQSQAQSSQNSTAKQPETSRSEDSTPSKPKVNSTDTKNNSGLQRSNQLVTKEQQILQARQLTNTLQNRHFGDTFLDQLVEQINQTTDGQKQLETLEKNLNISIQAWEEMLKIIDDISQQEQLAHSLQFKLKRILSLQTQSPESQRILLNQLRTKRELSSINENELPSTLKDMLTRFAETNEGQRQLKQLQSVLINGLENNWEHQKARYIVRVLIDENRSLGKQQRNQFKTMILREIGTRERQRHLEKFLTVLKRKLSF